LNYFFDVKIHFDENNALFGNDAFDKK